MILRQQILIADDEEEIREILKYMFEDDFDLVFSQDGNDALAKLDGHPDLIILDMHLPGVSGLEICEKVAEIEASKRPSIIVLSGDTSDALVKKAYQYGVSDYIGKPFNVVTFHERIIRFSNDVKNLKALQIKDIEIQSLAQTAMKQAASYGRALELVAKLNDCNTVDEIMKAVAKNLLNQDLNIAIQLRSDCESFSYDVDTQECSAVELQIFDVLKDHGRIYHFGRRSIFNDQHVSILVKNMPFEGTLSFDAILDVAAKLILAVNSRFVSLLEHQSLLATREKLQDAMGMLTQGIIGLENERRELMQSVELRIGLSFHELDMTDAQEQFFIKLIETEIRSREKSSNLVELQALISNCVDSMNISTVNKTNATDVNTEISDSDVELF